MQLACSTAHCQCQIQFPSTNKKNRLGWKHWESFSKFHFSGLPKSIKRCMAIIIMFAQFHYIIWVTCKYPKKQIPICHCSVNIDSSVSSAINLLKLICHRFSSDAHVLAIWVWCDIVNMSQRSLVRRWLLQLQLTWSYMRACDNPNMKTTHEFHEKLVIPSRFIS